MSSTASDSTAIDDEESEEEEAELEEEVGVEVELEEDEDYVPAHVDAEDLDPSPSTLVPVEPSHTAPTPPRRRRRRPARIVDDDDSDVEVFEVQMGNVIEDEEEEGDDGEKGGEEMVGCSGRSSAAEAEVGLVPNCPICLERWAQDGIHRVCCIPCGHVYGRSCLEKWAQRCGRNAGKCPQCNRKFRDKQIINLFAPQIAVASVELEKEVKSLREKNKSLDVEKKILLEELHKYKMRIIEMEDSERHKKACLDNTSPNCFNAIKRSFLHSFPESECRPKVFSNGFLDYNFILEAEVNIDEARTMDIDTCSQIIVISRVITGCGGDHAIIKISLLSPYFAEKIRLPLYVGTIKDIFVAPSNTFLPGRLSLLASLGKKLSIFSMESNTIALHYDLPDPAWSCSWDLNDPNRVYAGLQNGNLLVFDIRQTACPLHEKDGLSRNPLHTIRSVMNDDAQNSRMLLTASSVGPCLWDSNAIGESGFLIPELDKYGVCISLACDRKGEQIVASYRPKVDTSSVGMYVNSLTPAQHSPISGPGRLGTHVLLKKSQNSRYQEFQATFGSVSNLRLSKSVILQTDGNRSIFACGDEAYSGMCLWDVPSFQVVKRMNPHPHPILDVKYSRTPNRGLLGCISKSKLQLFSC